MTGASNGQVQDASAPFATGGGGGSGTVTSVSVTSINGFSGTVASATTAAAISITTTVTGLLKGDGTAVSAATADTDYQAPISLTTTGTSGAASFIGNVLNIPQYTGGGGSGITRSINSESGNFNMGSTAATDYVYFCSGTINATLPAAASNTNRYSVANDGSGVITIIGTVNGVVNPTVPAGNSVDIMSNGTNWYFF